MEPQSTPAHKLFLINTEISLRFDIQIFQMSTKNTNEEVPSP